MLNICGRLCSEHHNALGMSSSLKTSFLASQQLIQSHQKININLVQFQSCDINSDFASVMVKKKITEKFCLSIFASFTDKEFVPFAFLIDVLCFIFKFEFSLNLN